MKSHHLKNKLHHEEEKFKEAALSAARVEEFMLLEDKGYLETENDLEKTYKISQKDIKDNVDIQTTRKSFDLQLNDLGPYKVDYSRTGNHLLICGSKGHIASFDWKQGKLESEINVGESVRAGKWLQGDNQFYAAAQKKYVFIYDSVGTEVHKLKDHIDVTALEYLPFHFLLASVGNTGCLKYQDVSTGKLVADHKTRLGPTQSFTQNPYNAILHLGHGNGTVTLWSPTVKSPLIKLLASRGPIRSLAVDREGKYMACASSDKTVKIWDIRNFKEHVNSVYSPTPATSLHISESGLLGVGFSSHVQVWKDVFTTGSKSNPPYMNHSFPGSKVANVRFCPFEDILGVGHAKGVSSLIIPGSGEANFDGLEVNPFMNASREGRRENEVRELLNKLQPEMIVLDPTSIGKLASSVDTIRIKASERAEAQELGHDAPTLNTNLNTGFKSTDSRNAKVQKVLARDKYLQKQKLQRVEKLRKEKNALGPALGRFL